jgi:ribokinase
MIYVVGNVTIDSIYSLPRFPDPGETIVATGKKENLGGKGANQAIVLARCGLEVALVAALGKDRAASKLKAVVKKEGISVRHLYRSPYPTDNCSIYVNASGENHIVSVIEATQAFDPTEALSLIVKTEDILVFQGNLKPAVLRACLQLANASGAGTVLNPSPLYHPSEYDWSRVDLVVMNQLEAELLTSKSAPADAAKLLFKSGVKKCAITLGAKGAFFCDRSTHFFCGAPIVTAVDTTGAGDVFCGVLLASLIYGHTNRTAVGNAVRAAALTVTRAGSSSSFPTRRELNFIKR